VQPQRKSRNIQLLLLGGGMLAGTFCCFSGCLRNQNQASETERDPQWYDAQGQPIAQEWKTDENGKRIPVQAAYDRSGKPLRFDEQGNRIYSSTGYASNTSHYHRSGGWLPMFWRWGNGSSYRSDSSGRYRSGSSPGSTYFGGSKPGASALPSSGGKSSGGFGSTGSSGGS